MADTITLDAFTEALIWEAGVDGKAGPNARHVTARLYDLANRKYKQLRSLVTANGEEFFRTRTTPAALPSRTAGEDYISLPWPTGASEVVSIEVQLGSEWRELTPSSRRQWRVWPGPNRSDSPGEWSPVSMPQPSGATVTAGVIAVWPPTLSGSYAIDYVPHWVPITDPTHVFVLFPHWEEWLLCACTMVIVQRDNNKRNTYQDARDRLAEAQSQIIAHSRRARRGSVVARRRDGVEL
jgi:hypothetical protein